MSVLNTPVHDINVYEATETYISIRLGLLREFYIKYMKFVINKTYAHNKKLTKLDDNCSEIPNNNGPPKLSK